MIIACPACQTRYLVPDSAIGASGRRVRCANCRHSWFQDGNGNVAGAEEPAPLASALPVSGGPVPEGPVSEGPISAQPPLPPPPPRVAPPFEEPAIAADPAPDIFAPQPLFRPRRNPARLWMASAILVAVVACAAIAALLAFGGPGGLAVSAPAASSIQVFADPQVRKQVLPGGNELLVFSGKLTNPTAASQKVPDIRAELRDATGRIVYGWTIPAPISRLGPGASYAFSGSELDVPKGAAAIQFTPAVDATGR